MKLFNENTRELAARMGIKLDTREEVREDLGLQFQQELDELKQDIEVVAHFGFNKLKYGVQWLSAVQSFDDLPTDPCPNDCVYIENENTSYLYDGCGWVAFAAGVDLHTSGRERLRITAEGDMIVNTDQVNEALRELQGIWTCEQGAGEFWCDQSIIDELDARLQASEAWNHMLELYGKKKPRVLSSRP